MAQMNDRPGRSPLSTEAGFSHSKLGRKNLLRKKAEGVGNVSAYTVGFSHGPSRSGTHRYFNEFHKIVEKGSMTTIGQDGGHGDWKLKLPPHRVRVGRPDTA